MQRDTLLLGLRKGRAFPAVCPVRDRLCVFTGPYRSPGIPSAASAFLISATPSAPSPRTAGAVITESSFQVHEASALTSPERAAGSWLRPH